MNKLLQGFILGFAQGLTEFLPVSSSGHLVLLESLGVGENNLFFNLALHLATLAAVCIVMRKEIFAVLKNPLGSEMRFLVLSAVPTAAIAMFVKKYCSEADAFLPFFFILTSVVLVLPNVIKKSPCPLNDKTCVKDALIGGIAQGIACFAGLSRSGTTVSALSLCGVEGEEAAKLSFLMSIPVIVGGTAVEAATGGATGTDLPSLAVGAVTAFLVGIVAIKFFMKIMKSRKLWVFSIYTFLVGIASFLITFVKP